jgi:integrase
MAEYLTDKQILSFALESGIIDITHIQTQIEMNDRKKYLEQHVNKIWQATDGKWKTHLPDNMAKDGRRLIKARDRQALDDKIIEYYKAVENEPYIDAVFNEWNNERLACGEIEKQTYDRYGTDFTRFFKGTKILKTKFKYIDEDMLEEFIKTSIKEHELTAKAWGNLRILIRGIFKYAKKKGYTNISITEFLGDLELSQKVFKKRHFTDEESVFTNNEIDMIVNYINNEPVSIINLGVILAFQTGLRRGELSTLKLSDIRDGMLIVRRTEIKYKDENGHTKFGVRDETKTEAGMRKVILTDYALRTIRQIRLLNPFGEYLFMKDGKRCAGKAFTDKIKRICKNLSIQERSLHKARKSYATQLLNAGVNEKLIAKQLGHKCISTTKKYYYFNNQDVNEARNIITKAISS